MAMTLDEAIKHAEEQADKLGCCECADEHRQLAEWLKELKRFKDLNIDIDNLEIFIRYLRDSHQYISKSDGTILIK